MRPAYVRPKALCIAFDGVLARTEHAMREAIDAACASCRLSPTLVADPRLITHSAPIDVILRALADKQHADLLPLDFERAEAVFAARYAEAAKSCAVDTRILTIVDTFQKQLPRASAALVSPHTHALPAIADALGIASAFCVVAGASPPAGEHAEPTGSAYARAAAQLHARPVDCVGIASDLASIAAMDDVDMCAIGLRTDVHSAELLGSAGAWRIFGSPTALSPFTIVDVFRTGPPRQRPRPRPRCTRLPLHGSKDDEDPRGNET